MLSQTIQAISGSDGGGPYPWATPNDITSLDPTLLTAADCNLPDPISSSNTLFGVFGAFSIPSIAVLNGLVLAVRRVGVFNIQDNTIRMTLSGVEVGVNNAVVGFWGTSPEDVTYGGVNDTWGGAISIADLNAGLVGAAMRVNDNLAINDGAATNSWYLTAYYTGVTSSLIVATDA